MVCALGNTIWKFWPCLWNGWIGQLQERCVVSSPWAKHFMVEGIWLVHLSPGLAYFSVNTFVAELPESWDILVLKTILPLIYLSFLICCFFTLFSLKVWVFKAREKSTNYVYKSTTQFILSTWPPLSCLVYQSILETHFHQADHDYLYILRGHSTGNYSHSVLFCTARKP